ncbi:response regulator [Thermodesulfobacteriota bacterium]
MVDDELDMRTYVTTLLEANGFKPLSADDGVEGLKLARQEKPSLIILDIIMPKMGGIMMFHELKKDPFLKEIPIIMLSAISEKTFSHSYRLLSQEKGEAIHALPTYIEKPPEPEDLLEVIRNSLKPTELTKETLPAL